MRRTGPLRPRHTTAELIRATLATVVLLGVVLALTARPLATLTVLAVAVLLRETARRHALSTRRGPPAGSIPADAAAEPR